MPTRSIWAIGSALLDDEMPSTEIIEAMPIAVSDRIEASQQRQRRLVSDASHELRSPVAANRARLEVALAANDVRDWHCLLYTSPSPRDRTRSRMPSSA